MKKLLLTLGLLSLTGVMVACGGTSSNSSDSVGSSTSSSTVSNSEGSTSSDSETTTYTTAADILAMEKDTAINNYRGVVLALNKQGFVAQDATGLVYVFTKTAPTVAVGDYFEATGKASDYQTVMQLDASAGTVTKLDETKPTLTAPTITAWTNTEFDAYAAKPENLHYISIENATLDTSKYSNFKVEGSTVTGAFQYPLDEFNITKENDGLKVDLKGYAVGVTSGRVNFLVTEATIEQGGDPEEPGELPTEIADVTIGDLLADKETNKKDKFYRVTGILTEITNTTYGNGTLVDPATGDSITLYGLSPAETKDTDFTFADGELKFTNPKTFNTLNVEAGDQITVVGIYEYYKNTSTPEFMGYLESTKDKAEFTYTASVKVNDDSMGTATLSKTENITFGEEITVNVNPNEGYVVKSVKVNDKGISATDGVYKFAASVNNEVVVTFAEDAGELPEGTVVATYDFKNTFKDSASTQVSEGNANTFVEALNTASETTNLVSVSDYTKVYYGMDSTAKNSMLKFGSSSVDGKITFVFDATTTIKTVEVTGYFWTKATDGQFLVNGTEATGLNVATAWPADGEESTSVVTLPEATSSITFSAVKRFCAVKIVFKA